MPIPGVTGAGDAEPTIVLLHGATFSGRIWQSVTPELPSRYRVLVPTLAGHLGGNSLPAHSANVEGIVDDMCRQFDDAGIDSAHLVGNSPRLSNASSMRLRPSLRKRLAA